MEQILGRIADKTKIVKRNFGNLFADRIKEIRAAYAGDEKLIDEQIKNISILWWEINQQRKDFDELLLMLAKGNTIEFNELKKAPIKTFLLKYDSYVSEIEAIPKK